MATEFCGTSVTSSSRPQERTLEYVDMNPHIKYGRSDKRGFMLMEVTPAQTTTHFVGLDDVRDAASGAATLASFVVNAGRAGLNAPDADLATHPYAASFPRRREPMLTSRRHVSMVPAFAGTTVSRRRA